MLIKTSKIMAIFQYEWGERLKTDGERVYFDSLKVYGTQEETVVKPNDFVLIENQDNPESPFVARLESLYDNSTRESDSKRAVVSWFLR